MSNPDLEMGVRDSAALVIATLAEAKPKSLGKEEHLMSAILDTLFLLIENSPGPPRELRSSRTRLGRRI
jgi:hypothetical protein